MRFRIRSTPSGGLRVVREIPNGRLTTIEGQNGIGKTAAVRLLQLATGEQPFLSYPAAWTTLKQDLGPTTIEAEGMPEGILEWRLTPAMWPDTPEPVGPWIGEVMLDGNPFEWDKVPALLRVHRVAGDESLSQSLADQVQATLTSAARKFVSIEGAAAGWDLRIESLGYLTGAVTHEELVTARDETTAAETAYELAKSEAIKAREFLNRLDLARESRTRLGALIAELPALRTRLDELDRSETEIKRRLDELDEKAVQLLRSRQKSDDAVNEFVSLERLYTLRHDRRQRRQRELDHVLEAAGSASPNEFRAALPALRHELLLLRRQRLSLDRAGLLAELLDVLVPPLDKAVADSLGDEQIASVNDEAISVLGLRDGLRTTQGRIQGLETDEGRDLQRRIADLSGRVDQASRLFNAERLLRGAEKDAAETLTNLHRVFDRIGKQEGYEDIRRDREPLLDQLTQNAAEHSAVQQRVDELGDDDETTITTSLGPYSPDQVSDEEFAALRDGAESQLAELRLRQDETGTVLEGKRTHLRDRQAAVASAVREIEDDLSFDWLRSSSIELPRKDYSIDESVRLLTRLDAARRRLSEDLLGVRNDMQAYQQALDGLARRLRRAVAESDSADQRLVSAVREVFEEQFADELSAEEFRRTLFDDGSGVSLDLRRLSVTWTTVSGEKRTRPLEAFSSGERAFAYTRLQLEQIARFKTAHRVVVLDEFGAFIARDRRDELFRYIRRNVLGKVADQVIVILPLTQPLRVVDAATELIFQEAGA